MFFGHTLGHLNENDLMHPEIKSVINVSFSGDNFIENVVYIKTCFFHPQHPLRKHISTCVAYHQCPYVHVSDRVYTLLHVHLPTR